MAQKPYDQRRGNGDHGDLGGKLGFQTRTPLMDRTEFVNHFSNRLKPIRNHADGTGLAVRFGNGNGVGVDIETNKSYFGHANNSFECGSAPLGFTSAA